MSDYPYPENSGQTHFSGCYRHPRHHNCAVAEVDRLRAQRDKAVEALREIAEAIEPWVSYTLTASEYEPNMVAAIARATLAEIEGES